jgi:outer membrane receptor protein involved in Fe transport
MRDELDFSLQELRYVNIGKSRHRGVEAGLKLYVPGPTTLRANYTRQDVTLQKTLRGEHEGNAVKAIPRDVLTAGVSAAPERLGGLSGSVLVNVVSGTYLDDANTIRLPGHTTVGARLAYEYGLATASLEAENLLGATYSTTGFPDPLGAEQVYYYPAAGRILRLGLTVEL